MSLRDSLRDLRADITEELSTNGGAPISFDGRTVGTIAAICVLLTIFYYYARPNFYRSTLAGPVEQLLGMGDSTFASLLPYAYWSAASVVVRVLVPLALIVFWYRASPSDYGFRFWKKGHGWVYLGMYMVMMPLLVGVSFLPSFQDKYPFYDHAGESVWHFVLYELCYGVQFFSLEAFFRGFIIFALFKKFGYHAVLIMTIPYCLIHFGKPVPETLGAVVAGLLLGFMAIHSKSFLPGALLHWSVGFTMDIACMAQKWFG